MNLFKLRHWIVLCMAFAYALAQAAEVIAPAATKARFSCSSMSAGAAHGLPSRHEAQLSARP